MFDISTILHFLFCVHRAFGWDPPQYAHLPLIMNADGTKLSKRQGDIQVQSMRQQGFFPQALVNFITKAGGGFKNASLDEVYSIQQLIQKVRIFKN